MDETEKRFQEIHDTYRSRILRYLTRLIGEGEAEDLVQEVFTRVALGLQDFRGDAALSTWIYKIATNAARDRFRRSAALPVKRNTPREKVFDAADEDGRSFTINPCETEDVEERVIRKEMSGCIREIIDTLPEAYRSVILLSDLEGMTDRDIADILDLTLGAAKIRLHRARSILKKDLQKACVFYRNEQNELACDRKDNSRYFSFEKNVSF